MNKLSQFKNVLQRVRHLAELPEEARLASTLLRIYAVHNKIAVIDQRICHLAALCSRRERWQVGMGSDWQSDLHLAAHHRKSQRTQNHSIRSDSNMIK